MYQGEFPGCREPRRALGWPLKFPNDHFSKKNLYLPWKFFWWPILSHLHQNVTDGVRASTTQPDDLCLDLLTLPRPLLQPRAPGQYTTWPPLICHGEFDYHFTLMGEYDIKCKFSCTWMKLTGCEIQWDDRHKQKSLCFHDDLHFRSRQPQLRGSSL